MMEVEPCEKSPAESNWKNIEKKQLPWLKDCYRKATSIVVEEFNEFNRKFAEFIDRLAWTSGCGARTDSIFGDPKYGNGWTALSEYWSTEKKLDSDGVEIIDWKDEFRKWRYCDWAKEEEAEKDMWEFDHARARGWT